MSCVCVYVLGLYSLVFDVSTDLRSENVYIYLSTPPYEQDVTQGQFLRGV